MSSSLFNIVLFLVAMSLLGVEPALYSILTYITAARTLDFVIYGLEQFTAITIMSSQSAAIRTGSPANSSGASRSSGDTAA